MSFAVTQGGTTIQAAADQTALVLVGTDIQAATASYFVTGLTAGTYTITAEYRSPTGNASCSFDNRSIWAIPLQ
jgi:hypothetical protein